MAFLQNERRTLERFLPGLDGFLARTPLSDMERPGNPALPAFRQHGGPGLLIPAAYGGSGATALEAVQAQRAIGSRAPSLAVATTMHHFSVAGLVHLAGRGPGLEAVLLGQIAAERMYVASGVAEGRSGAGMLSSAMSVRRRGGDLLISGSKKPCSLSKSMHLLTASVILPADGPHGGELAFVTIPADAPGIERRPFWKSPALAGAESDEVILRDVAVAADWVTYLDAEGMLVQVGLLWFELLISATYLGIASGLAERVLASKRGSASERVQVALELESAMAALEGIARAMDSGAEVNDTLARMLLVRYAVQNALERATARSFELLGGLAFIGGEEVALLHAAASALALHPPSRLSTVGALDGYLGGAPFVLE
ncbi:MAG: acyl-CoA dehydrogenase family protein [Gemmataceae bacterium]